MYVLFVSLFRNSAQIESFGYKINDENIYILSICVWWINLNMYLLSHIINWWFQTIPHLHSIDRQIETEKEYGMNTLFKDRNSAWWRGDGQFNYMFPERSADETTYLLPAKMLIQVTTFCPSLFRWYSNDQINATKQREGDVHYVDKLILCNTFCYVQVH